MFWRKNIERDIESLKECRKETTQEHKALMKETDRLGDAVKVGSMGAPVGELVEQILDYLELEIEYRGKTPSRWNLRGEKRKKKKK